MSHHNANVIFVIERQLDPDPAVRVYFVIPILCNNTINLYFLSKLLLFSCLFC